MGTVYKLGKIWWVTYYAEGKRVRESTRTPSKKRAEQLLAKRQAEIFEGRFNIQDTKPSPRFDKFAAKYLKTYSKQNKRPSTHDRDRSLIAHLVAFFGAKRLKDFTPFLIEHYRERRRSAGRTPATVNREVACLKAMFNVAGVWGVSTVNPAKKVKQYEEDNEIVNPITDEDEVKLLEHATPRLKDFIVCGIDTGMRSGEMFNLSWTDVDFSTRTLRVVKSKTKKGKRTIPISARLYRVLVRRQSESNSAYVFANSKTGGRLTKVRNAWVRANELAGLRHKRYRVHDMRGTFITRLFEEGLNEMTIKQLSGHSTTKMLERYARPGEDLRRDAISALDKRRNQGRTVIDFEETRR